MIRVLWWGMLALLIGCGEQKSVPPSAKPLPAREEPWRTEETRLNGVIRAGMTKEDVTRLLGEPKEAWGIDGGRSSSYWLYPLTSNLYYRVDFDERDRVENRRAWSGSPKPQ